METKQYDFFISHSHLDKEIAVNLCKILEAKKRNCWIAPRNVGVGLYSNSIIEGIEKSKALVLLLSENSNNSIPVLNELEAATTNNLMIIPVRIEDVLPTKEMGYYIRTNNWFDNFQPESITDFKKIADELTGNIDSKRTVTQKFTPVKNKSKEFYFKNFTFIFLFLTVILSFFSINSYAMITQQQELIEQQQKIIEQQYLREKERYKNNLKVVSQAEHIKNIAGFKEAIKYFRSKNKNLFYTKYENIKILNFVYSDRKTTNNKIITINNGYNNLNRSEKFHLIIETRPISSNIKILNSKIKYKNNILLDRGIYSIEISGQGYGKKIFNIKIDKDTRLDVDLESIKK